MLKGLCKDSVTSPGWGSPFPTGNRTQCGCHRPDSGCWWSSAWNILSFTLHFYLALLQRVVEFYVSPNLLAFSIEPVSLWLCDWPEELQTLYFSPRVALVPCGSGKAAERLPNWMGHLWQLLSSNHSTVVMFSPSVPQAPKIHLYWAAREHPGTSQCHIQKIVRTEDIMA